MESSVPAPDSSKANQLNGDGKTMLVQIMNDQNGPKLICPICSKALVSLNGYVKHLKKHDPPGGFLCKLCEESFCTDDLLKKHRQDLHSALSCRICHETFSAAGAYREHIRVQHDGIDRKMSVCTICGIEFKTKEALKRHESTKCGQIKPHKCDECEMAFYTIYNLKEHKKIHRGEKKYCCSYCGKDFLQKGRLLVHERSHTGEKPYKCDICGKCFAHRESFVTHSSIHTGVKLIECKCCSARFSCHSNLIKHRRSRPDTCGMSIYDRSKDSAVRTGRSRIPASLMTSEIRISNANKVIVSSEPQKSKNIHIAEVTASLDSSNLLKTHRKETKSRVGRRRISSDDPDDCSDFDPLDDDDIDDDDNGDDDDDSKNEVKFRESNVEILIKNENEIERDFKLHDINMKSIKMEGSCDLSSSFVKEGDEEKGTGNFERLKIERFSTNEVSAITEDENNKVDVSQMLNLPYVLQECSLLIEDVCHQYPELITDKTIKIEQTATSCAISPTLAEKKEQKPKQAQKIASPSKEEDSSKGAVRRIYQSELKQRMKLMKKDKTYECIECIKVYHIRKPYETHLRENHQKTDDELKDIFKDEDGEILNEMVYKCPYCPKIYLIEKRLQSHITLHGVDGSLVHKCPCYCTKFFSSRNEAFEHAKLEHRDLIYCSVCEKFKNTPDGLKNHMLKHAPEKEQRIVKRNLVCDKCAKKFASRTSLIDHTRSDCGRNPIYQCDVCEKRFTSAGILKTHKLLHKDETPFQCDQCGKTFKVKAQYIAHMKIRHTDYKPFKCHLCPKEYPYRESLLTHMTVHTGLKRFACDGCGKRFTCISNLQAHRKVNADSCGLLPLNAKASQYMGVQKGVLLVGNKPEAGLV